MTVEEVTITREKLVDKNMSILNEMEVLKKALEAKTMGKEKTDMLSKWILDEKSRQIKEEITNKAYEPIDKAQNVESRDGSSVHGEYEEPYTKGENPLKIDTNQEDLKTGKENDLGNLKGDDNTLKPDENVQENSEPRIETFRGRKD